MHHCFLASSSSSAISSSLIPSTPTTANSSQHACCSDSTTLITDISTSQKLSNNSPRISAIRELIETEQRYVNDLRVVADDFIRPLSSRRILKDYEIDQLFSNWFSLIACNIVFLSTLEEQVQYKDNILTSNIDVSIRTSRSVSMSNIAEIVQVKI